MDRMGREAWYTEWHLDPDEIHVLSHAFDHLWNEPGIARHFSEFQTWAIIFKSASPAIAPMPEDAELFEALTRLALAKLSDLNAGALLECGSGCSVAEHRKILRNFRARNLGLED